MDIIVLSLIPELSLLALNPTAVVFQVSKWYIQLSLNSILAFIELKSLINCYDKEQFATWGCLLRWLSMEVQDVDLEPIHDECQCSKH